MNPFVPVLYIIRIVVLLIVLVDSVLESTIPRLEKTIAQDASP